MLLTLKNCIEPPSYARTAYVVAIWPSFLFDSFIKIWATCEIFLGKWFTAPPGKKIPVRLCHWDPQLTTWRAQNSATYSLEGHAHCPEWMNDGMTHCQWFFFTDRIESSCKKIYDSTLWVQYMSNSSYTFYADTHELSRFMRVLRNVFLIWCTYQ